MIFRKYILATFLCIICACHQKEYNENTTSSVENHIPTHDTLPDFRLIGTEPFWSSDIIGDSIHFSTAEGYHSVESIDKKYQSEHSYTFQSDHIFITLVADSCSDGMSDRKYSYSAIQRVDSLTYYGCAYILR